jgi:hypothetical protein
MPEPLAAESPPTDRIRQRYAARLEELTADRDGAAAESRRLAIARGVVFVVGLVAFLLAAWPGTGPAAPLAVLAGLAAVVFIALVHRHEVVERRRAEAALRVAFNAEGVARLDRRWDAIADRSAAPHDEHPYAADLGVTGPESLVHLVGGWCTPLGRKTLSAWLLAPALPAVVGERQRAVAALASQHELRETLGARARSLQGATPERFAGFTAWAAGPRWFTSATWRPWLVRVVTALIAGGVVLHAAGVVGWAAWLPPMVVGWVLTAVWRGRTHETFTLADPGRRLFTGFPALLSALLEAPPEGALASVRARLAAGAAPAHAAVERLDSLLAAADARHMWLHFVLQSLTLWDFHVVAALERWQRESGAHAAEWLDALGDAEALAALAMLRHDHPHWSVPAVDAGAEREVAAQSLTHPLLPPDHAIGNDVRIGPPGTVVVITGSNMSGKSTLLRGVGLNVVLALAGGPVAARSLRIPPMRVATCMRVEDSLASGVSYFMAELLRLRRVAETVEQAGGRGEAALYLIDEILQGTNTAERRVAAVHVIERLVRSGALGVVTTHDLDLADAAELRAAANEVHFQERVDESTETMSFDYRLRPGRATSVNALRLMRMVGL